MSAKTPSVTGEPDRGDARGGGGDDPGRGSDRDIGLSELWDRLRGRVPVPTLAEPEQEAPELTTLPSSDAEGKENVRVAVHSPSPAEIADELDQSGPDLDRLSVLEPRLSGLTPSGWILVKNRAEVRRFIRWGYVRGKVAPDAAGTVGVAFWVDASGKVKWAEISDSSGRRDLDRMALDLFRNVIQFWPAREDGTPVATSAIFSVVFPWP